VAGIVKLSSKPTTTPRRKDKVAQPVSRLAQAMLIVHLTIPLMFSGIAVAVVPLLWATKHHQTWEDRVEPAVRAAYVTGEDQFIATRSFEGLFSDYGKLGPPPSRDPSCLVPKANDGATIRTSASNLSPLCYE
jgi:hypothetical protein